MYLQEGVTILNDIQAIFGRTLQDSRYAMLRLQGDLLLFRFSCAYFWHFYKFAYSISVGLIVHC